MSRNKSNEAAELCKTSEAGEKLGAKTSPFQSLSTRATTVAPDQTVSDSACSISAASSTSQTFVFGGRPVFSPQTSPKMTELPTESSEQSTTPTAQPLQLELDPYPSVRSTQQLLFGAVSAAERSENISVSPTTDRESSPSPRLFSFFESLTSSNGMSTFGTLVTDPSGEPPYVLRFTQPPVLSRKTFPVVARGSTPCGAVPEVTDPAGESSPEFRLAEPSVLWKGCSTVGIGPAPPEPTLHSNVPASDLTSQASPFGPHMSSTHVDTAPSSTCTTSVSANAAESTSQAFWFWPSVLKEPAGGTNSELSGTSSTSPTPATCSKRSHDYAFGRPMFSVTVPRPLSADASANPPVSALPNSTAATSMVVSSIVTELIATVSESADSGVAATADPGLANALRPDDGWSYPTTGSLPREECDPCMRRSPDGLLAMSDSSVPVNEASFVEKCSEPPPVEVDPRSNLPCIAKVVVAGRKTSPQVKREILPATSGSSLPCRDGSLLEKRSEPPHVDMCLNPTNSKAKSAFDEIRSGRPASTSTTGATRKDRKNMKRCLKKMLSQTVGDTAPSIQEKVSGPSRLLMSRPCPTRSPSFVAPGSPVDDNDISPHAKDPSASTSQGSVSRTHLRASMVSEPDDLPSCSGTQHLSSVDEKVELDLRDLRACISRWMLRPKKRTAKLAGLRLCVRSSWNTFMNRLLSLCKCYQALDAVFLNLSLAYDLVVWISQAMRSEDAPLCPPPQDVLSFSPTSGVCLPSDRKRTLTDAFNAAAKLVGCLSRVHLKTSFANFRSEFQPGLDELRDHLARIIDLSGSNLPSGPTKDIIQFMGANLSPKWDAALRDVTETVESISKDSIKDKTVDQRRTLFGQATELALRLHRLRPVLLKREEITMGEAFRRCLWSKIGADVKTDVFKLVEYVLPDNFLKFCGSWQTEQPIVLVKLAKLTDDLLYSVMKISDDSHENLIGFPDFSRIVLWQARKELRNSPMLESFEDAVTCANIAKLKLDFFTANDGNGRLSCSKSVNEFLDAWLQKVCGIADFARKCAHFLATLRKEAKESLSMLEQEFLVFSIQTVTDILGDCCTTASVTPVGDPCEDHEIVTELFEIFRCAPHHRLLRLCVRHVYSLEQLLLPMADRLIYLSLKYVSESKLVAGLQAILKMFPNKPDTHPLLLRKSMNETTRFDSESSPPWKNVADEFASFVVGRAFPSLPDDDKSALSTIFARWLLELSKLRFEISKMDANVLVKTTSNKPACKVVNQSECSKILVFAQRIIAGLGTLTCGVQGELSDPGDLCGIAAGIPPGVLMTMCIDDASEVLEVLIAILAFFPLTAENREKLVELISQSSKALTKDASMAELQRNLWDVYKSWVILCPPLAGEPQVLVAAKEVRICESDPAGSSFTKSIVAELGPPNKRLRSVVTRISSKPASGRHAAETRVSGLAVADPVLETVELSPPLLGTSTRHATVSGSGKTDSGTKMKEGPPAKKPREADDLIEHTLYAEIHRLVAQKKELANKVEANRHCTTDILKVIDQRRSETLEDALKRLSEGASRLKRAEHALAEHEKRLETLGEEAMRLFQLQNEFQNFEVRRLAAEKAVLSRKLLICRDLVFLNGGSLTDHLSDDLTNVARELNARIEPLRAVVSQIVVIPSPTPTIPEHSTELHAILNSTVLRMADSHEIDLSITEILQLFKHDVVPQFVLAQKLHCEMEQKIRDATELLDAREQRLAELE